MQKSKIIFYLSAFILLLPLVLQGQISDTIFFGAEESDSLITVECSFESLPALDSTFIMNIKLKALDSDFNNRTANYQPPVKIYKHLKEIGKPKIKYQRTENSLWLISTGPSPYLKLQNGADSLIKWPLPILMKDSLNISVPIKVNGVGKLDISLTERTCIMNPLVFYISIVIDENGKLQYLGKNPPSLATPLGAHPYLFAKDINDHLVGRIVRSDREPDVLMEPFDIEVQIDPKFKVKDSSQVRLNMTAMSATLEEIQYEIVLAHNLKIDSIPPSQGTNPGPDSSFTAAFTIIPQGPGRSFLSFEVFGRMETPRGFQQIGSKVSYEMVFGNDGELLYLGKIDPFKAGFEAGNPVYAPIDGIMEFKDGGYGLRVERSEPDFVYDRLNEQRIQDSTNNALRMDSINQIEQEIAPE